MFGMMHFMIRLTASSVQMISSLMVLLQPNIILLEVFMQPVHTWPILRHQHDEKEGGSDDSSGAQRLLKVKRGEGECQDTLMLDNSVVSFLPMPFPIIKVDRRTV
jgi:hypothetical protein